MRFFVMPAWIAGIQVCKDASGNIHVNLDSSTPCWNDSSEGWLNWPRPLRSLFSKEGTKEEKKFTAERQRAQSRNLFLEKIIIPFVTFVMKSVSFPTLRTPCLCGESYSWNDWNLSDVDEDCR
jgi:hypothetical protein